MICFKLFLLISIAYFHQVNGFELTYKNGTQWRIKIENQQQAELMNQVKSKNPEIILVSIDDGRWNHINKVSYDQTDENEQKHILASAPSCAEARILDALRSTGLTFATYEDFGNSNRGTGESTRYVMTSGKPVPYEVSIKNFKYDMPSADELAAMTQKVNLIDRITVPNNSPATVIISLSETQKLAQTWSISFTESLSLLLGGKMDLTLPDIGGGGLQASLTLDFSSTQSISQTIERAYGIARDIAIPPHTTIQAQGYINWLKDIDIPFVSDGKVMLDKAKPISEDSALIYCPLGTSRKQCTQKCSRTTCQDNCSDGGSGNCNCCSLPITGENGVSPNVMRDYLIAQGLHANVTETGKNKLKLRLTGIFTASTGTDIVFSVNELKGSNSTSGTTHTKIGF